MPKSRPIPPAGAQWSHEIKFDGWRIQLHKLGDAVCLFSKNGHDVTRRFKPVADAAAKLKSKSLILDAEIVATNTAGTHNFAALHLRPQATTHTLTLWVFDILMRDNEDLRSLPLSARRTRLKTVLRNAPSSLRLSESFPDPLALLNVANQMQMEGIVCKRLDLPYRSGPRSDWIKVKTTAWRVANQQRFKLFRK